MVTWREAQAARMENERRQLEIAAHQAAWPELCLPENVPTTWDGKRCGVCGLELPKEEE